MVRHEVTVPYLVRIGVLVRWFLSMAPDVPKLDVVNGMHQSVDLLNQLLVRNVPLTLPENHD